MEFKGTKGEWKFDEFDVYVDFEDNEIGNLICLAPEKFKPSMKNWKANAQLIATAPELLKALQDVISSLGGEYDINDDVYKQSIKVINKALGNENNR